MSFGNPAQRYRERVDQAGGVLAQQARQVGKAFGRRAMDADDAAQITQLLADEGVAVDPSLNAVAEREFVQLYNQEHDSRRQPDDSPTDQRQALDQAMQAAQSGTHTTGVLVGAAATTVGFAAIGFGGYWVYGLIYLLLGGLGLGFLYFRLPWFVRWLFPRFRFLRLSWWLGAGWMFALAVLVSLSVIGPIAGTRQAQARERDAKHEVRLARASLRDGRLDEADRHLKRARDRHGSVAGISAVEDDLQDAREKRADEARNRRRYDGAVAAMRDDDYLTAISNMGALADYRDARTLTKEFKATASRETLTRATRETNLSIALTLAHRADGFRSTPQTRGFIRRAEGRLAAARRQRRAQQRLAAQRRKAARLQRRLAEQERQRRNDEQAQRELDQENAPPSDDGGGGSGTPGCLGPEACPGKRDGDGDGCYCE